MKLYQINAEDLTTLEELIPELTWLLGEKFNDTSIRMKVRRVKEILSNVRWNYGPPSEVEIHPAIDPDDPTQWKTK